MPVAVEYGGEEAVAEVRDRGSPAQSWPLQAGEARLLLRRLQPYLATLLASMACRAAPPGTRSRSSATFCTGAGLITRGGESTRPGCRDCVRRKCRRGDRYRRRNRGRTVLLPGMDAAIRDPKVSAT